MFKEDDSLAELITSLKFHGKGDHTYDNEHIGMNSRLDTLQAAILLEKVSIYADEIKGRNEIADNYIQGLQDTGLKLPAVPDGCQSVWAQFTLKAANKETRASIISALKEQGIPGVIYYSLPAHQQTTYIHYPVAGNGLPNSE